MRKFVILIAEDDADDRYLLKMAFAEKGLTDNIHFAENGKDVIEYLAKNKLHLQQLPKLILLDLNMPQKDGRQVLREIKENSEYKKIPVVVFSTSKNEVVIEKCYELGANSYIIKPISFDGLLQVVEQIRAYWIQTASLPA